MRSICTILCLFVVFSCYAEEGIPLKIQLSFDEPRAIDARKFYDESNLSEDEIMSYVYLIEDFFNGLEEIDHQDSSIISLYSGTWVLFDMDILEEGDYQDFSFPLREIDFGYFDYYGYSFDFKGNYAHTAYKQDGVVISSINSIGYVAPIMRFQIWDERMYIYILNNDSWELADFHEGGENYFYRK